MYLDKKELQKIIEKMLNVPISVKNIQDQQTELRKIVREACDE